MKRFALVLLFLFSIFFLSSKFHIALADGMVIHFNPYSNRYDYTEETDQQAYINYQNGLEKMILSVKLNEANNNSVWIFPVPANPNNISIDIIKSLPKFSGEEISQKAKSNLYDIKKAILQTQIYTIPIISIYESMQPVRSTNMKLIYQAANTPIGINKSPIEQDVNVYDHLEKEGMTTEVITAKTANGLYEYLKNKGLNIENQTIPVLDRYIGKEYSFVASWISPLTITREEVETYAGKKLSDHDTVTGRNSNTRFGKFLEEFIKNNLSQPYDPNWYNDPDIKDKFISELYALAQKDPLVIDKETPVKQRGIFVSFPSPAIYFPLIPTSVYQDVTIPISIRILGYNSPKIPKAINNFTKIKYFSQAVMNVESGLTGFFSESNNSGPYPYITYRDVRYTKIDINVPSKLLTEDLWINPIRPKKILVSNFIIQYPVVFGLVLFLAISVLTGITIGIILFKDLRRNVFKLGLIGASNCLSIFGLLFVTKMVRTKNISDEAKLLLTEIKNKGYFWKRRVAYLLFISIIITFVIPLIICVSIFMISTPYQSLIMYLTDPLLIAIGAFAFPFIVFLLVWSLLAFVAGFIFKNIRHEDDTLFERLKKMGYSSWTFQPKDQRKLVFVILYSLMFLETTIIAVNIVEKIL